LKKLTLERQAKTGLKIMKLTVKDRSRQGLSV
jgi:hypothetical protein